VGILGIMLGGFSSELCDNDGADNIGGCDELNCDVGLQTWDSNILNFNGGRF